MVWWWWIVPTAVAVLGAIWLLLALIGLFRGRILSGIFGGLGGVAGDGIGRGSFGLERTDLCAPDV
jgi:hypothetical protein